VNMARKQQQEPTKNDNAFANAQLLRNLGTLRLDATQSKRMAALNSKQNRASSARKSILGNLETDGPPAETERGLVEAQGNPFPRDQLNHVMSSHGSFLSSPRAKQLDECVAISGDGQAPAQMGTRETRPGKTIGQINQLFK